MLIRKQFKFEGAHVVRNCTSDRCKYSIHGHSYKVEVLLEADALDNGQMILDFGLMKGPLKDLIDSFDHATTFWNDDDKGYLSAVMKYSKRWVGLPVSPSAEQYSRVFFRLAQAVLDVTDFANNEPEVRVHSVIVHETATGYAQSFWADAFNAGMGKLELDDINFSVQVQEEWKDRLMWEKIKRAHKAGEKCFTNTLPEQQVR